MKPEDRARIARNLWGFFTICVWLVGVPKVIEIAITGSRSGLNQFTCATASYNCPPTIVKDGQSIQLSVPGMDRDYAEEIAREKEAAAIEKLNRKGR